MNDEFKKVNEENQSSPAQQPSQPAQQQAQPVQQAAQPAQPHLQNAWQQPSAPNPGQQPVQPYCPPPAYSQPQQGYQAPRPVQAPCPPPAYGQPQQVPQPTYVRQVYTQPVVYQQPICVKPQIPGNGLGIGSLVLAIFSLVYSVFYGFIGFCFGITMLADSSMVYMTQDVALGLFALIVLPLVTGMTGIILGIVSKAKKNPKAMPVVGIVLSALSIVICVASYLIIMAIK